MDFKEFYHCAVDYLESVDGMSSSILKDYMYKKQNPSTLSEVCRQMCVHAANRSMMRNVIGDVSNLSSTLYDFDPKRITKKFADSSEVLERLKGFVGLDIRTEKRSLWPAFARSIYSISEFLSDFDSYESYHEFVISFTRSGRNESLFALPLILSQEIEGFGFALACDFCKENVSPDFVKPDVHIRETLSYFGFVDQNASDYKIFKFLVHSAKEIGVLPYDVDKVLWLIGSGRLYLHGEKKLPTSRAKFYSHMSQYR